MFAHDNPMKIAQNFCACHDLDLQIARKIADYIERNVPQLAEGTGTQKFFNEKTKASSNASANKSLASVSEESSMKVTPRQSQKKYTKSQQGTKMGKISALKESLANLAGTFGKTRSREGQAGDTRLLTKTEYTLSSISINSHDQR